MKLDEDSHHLIAFTIPGQGQFQWVTSPMGLLGCLASFQRLMETVLRTINNVIVYIDDLLVVTATHEDNLVVLEKVFERLHSNQLKINLEKCILGNQEVSYLGFTLAPWNQTRKEQIASNLECPTSNNNQVRYFVGLCNYFRTHFKRLAITADPLFKVTRKDSEYKSGSVLPDAQQAFRVFLTTTHF